MFLLQSERNVSISTPLGADQLVFWRMTAHEALSSPFRYELELLSENGEIVFDELLGKPASVTLTKGEAANRYFHGYITGASYQGTLDRFHHYNVTLTPWLWFLDKSTDCRIFQEMTVPEIIKQVFRDAGFSDFEEQLEDVKDYPKREYCVQYAETSLAFVNRLLEQEGIYYFFKHEKEKHILVLTNSSSSLTKQGIIPYFSPENERRRKQEHINSWQLNSQLQPGKYTSRDYDFVKPSLSLETRRETEQKRVQGDKEIYRYPGDYYDSADGERYAKIRLQELQTANDMITGSGDATKIHTGSLFTLTGYPRSDQNDDYLITSAEYTVYSNSYISYAGMDDDTAYYHCDFCAVTESRHYRPQQKTARPRINGPQTAVVVGPSAEEIYTDKHGRIKVQFHWDRQGKQDDTSSCWIRVSQALAGKHWGGLFVPRIGQEVIVNFLEGDPDRPIVTGSVFNGNNIPPYQLPDNKTQSGIKSRSSKSGQEANFNELRFEDLKDKEEVYFHAEKDFNRVVENNDTLKVGFEKQDAGDQSVEIYNNRSVRLEVGNDQLTLDKGDRSVDVTAGKITETAAKSIELKVGATVVKLDTSSISEQAAQSIELKVGASSIKLEPGKITLTSPQVEIKANATLKLQGAITEVKGDASLKASGTATEVEGSAVLKLKGGVTLIN